MRRPAERILDGAALGLLSDDGMLELSAACGVIAVPHSEIAIPHSEIAVLDFEIAVPHSEIAVPHSEIAVPHSEIAVPHSEIAVPHSEIDILDYAIDVLHFQRADRDSQHRILHSHVGGYRPRAPTPQH